MTNITTRVVGSRRWLELGMNSYLAVARGSENEAMMAIIEYKATPTPSPSCWQGLTFDSGGISIKPADGMDEMKYDMGGAARARHHARPGPVAAAHQRHRRAGGLREHAGGNAYRPGDILTTMSGQTVEVLNTDAEGRLVCDALTCGTATIPRP